MAKKVILWCSWNELGVRRLFATCLQKVMPHERFIGLCWDWGLNKSTCRVLSRATAELEIILSVLIWERITTFCVLWDKRIKIKTWHGDVIFVCKLGKGKEKEPRRNLPEKTWETCLEVCLAARYGRSQLINFTFQIWEYFSLYYLTKNMNDFAWCGGVLVQPPLLCHKGASSTVPVENHF